MASSALGEGAGSAKEGNIPQTPVSGPLPAESSAAIPRDIGETEVDEDVDSALGADPESDTTSLASTILRHREEFGRTYHKFRGGENDYWGPNDEQQNDQLDIGHHMFLLLLKNRLYIAPIDLDKCRYVLDLGTGTGIWAIDFADAHPSAEVTGVDLSPIQPSWLPPNCHFMIDDIEKPWEEPNDHFDFIHMRCLYGSIADWPALFKQAFEHTAPGGWVQSMEIDIQFATDDGTLGPDHTMLQWSDVFFEAGEKMGKTFRVAHHTADWMADAGFRDIQSQWFKIPVGKWPKDKSMKELGIWNFHYCFEGCEGWALYLLTKVLGWSIDECRVLVAKFRNALKDNKTHAYYLVNVTWARKPRTSVPHNT